ncbi:ABC-2 transporter permease [Virgibacillus soli]|uniref:ABC-2 transporter permease n=1 Tax=Paracerasibacillus soli TaxID=480284 RepID=A0ABU5CRP1_9BACI|nr:ABC-2 transporter permease [Virgibacillus soli]MDY0409039.1 ABC-2 transporter permease [Virgibacillus soli]
MVQMMKRDYMLNKIYFFFILIGVPILYIFQYIPTTMFIVMTLGLVFNVFFYEDRNHVTRAIISMPVSTSQAVVARYIFITLTAVCNMMYFAASSSIIKHYPNIIVGNPASFQPLTISQGILTLHITFILLAISLPFYYYFQSAYKSLIIQGIVVFLSTLAFIIFINSRALGVLANIPDWFIAKVMFFVENPNITIGFGFVISIACLYLSYIISFRFFTKRDII